MKQRPFRFFFQILLLAAWVLLSGREPLRGGDILRGGAGGSAATGRKASEARSDGGAAAAEAARVKAQDRLARTTKAVNDMRAMQAAARAAGGSGGIPDGLVPGGLQRYAPGEANFRWEGANAPVESGGTVNITQTKQQAVLHWKSFNVGKNTTLNFDQSAGGADVSKWIAFNKVLGTAAPSQIRGKINAGGQIYIINQNGIIFGAGSQVNARTVVASALPINDALVERGLLSQEAGSAYSFLFEAPSSAGDVVVEPGASLESPVSAEGNGGRIMLVGSNVRNGGTISTPSGQTILAAGLQVGIDAHRPASSTESDPSLRGIDVYIGNVGEGGTAENAGLIEAARGSVWMAGKAVGQLGVIESSTSVSLNGRVDLKASYGATPNASYNPAEFLDEVLPFSPTQTGTVTLGQGSLIRILPETSSSETSVGTELPLKTAVNIEGRNIHLASGATVMAPSGTISLKAGIWGSPSTGASRLVRSGGQVYIEGGALIDVSGTVGVSAPLSESLLSVQLRGSELADSPLQRGGSIRGVSLTVDVRKSGTYGGQEWVGTPLGDVTGFVSLVERGAGALTTKGGSVEISAGESVILRQGATIDVSGGWTRYEGGKVRTTRLLEKGRIVDIADATPDREYDGIFTGRSSKTHTKWGVTKTFQGALAPTGEYTQAAYYHGADAGSISVTAPAMALDADLLGTTVAGARQLRASPTTSDMPKGGSLALAFHAQDKAAPFLTSYPTPPTVIFQQPSSVGGLAGFSVDASGLAEPIAAGRAGTVEIDPAIFSQEHGFSSLKIENEEGSVSVPGGVALSLPAGGELSITASNIRIAGSVTAPGGSLEFKALNVSPYNAAVLKAQLIAPVESPGRGIFTLESGAVLSAAGLVVDDRFPTRVSASTPFAPDGGSVRIEAYVADLQPGSVIDVSGGLSLPANGARRVKESAGSRTYSDYGDAGSITVLAGQDPNEGYVHNGSLRLGSELRGYGGVGGSLSIQAPLVQIGGTSSDADTLLLQPEFFSTGGFESFSIAGLGRAVGQSGAMRPALVIQPGTVIEPVVQTVRLDPHPRGEASAVLRTITKPAGERRPVDLAFLAPGIKDFDGTSTLVRGDLILGEGAVVRTDPGGSVSLKGNTVAVLGSIFAPGGDITISGGKNSLSIFPLDLTQALTTVYIGPRSVLSAAGTFVRKPDSLGRVRGTVLPGGSISVSGNIVAARGAVLDVSGSSAVVDLLPSEVSPENALRASPRSGLTAPLADKATVPVRIDSDGGTITLEGGQMLFTDATLKGAAGGPGALGGELIVSSGRFYPDPTLPVPVFDTNLVVTQSRPSIPVPLPESAEAIGRAVRGPGDSLLVSRGYFAADQFASGGFDSLELGGSVEFQGDVTIAARRELHVASGGVIKADGDVRLSGAYVALGQAFQPPVPFADLTHPFGSKPTSGVGTLSVTGRWIDVGSLSLHGIGRASLSAPGGDIRGSGVLDVAGDLTLEAARIYPATASSFTITAYDRPDGSPGSVTIVGAGTKGVPLSAGGRLSIFASVIRQGGTLRAPLGQIILGWDGTGTQPGVPAPGVLPSTTSLTLASGSLTSVSAVDAAGKGVVIPFGISPDGESWIDPTGVDISAGGLIEKSVSLAGASVSTEPGSVVDLRGGGDLYAYQWVSGTGGSADLLGTTTEKWSATKTYRAGDLVLSESGRTYSARRTVTPSDFSTSSVPDPSEGRYWKLLPESYAVIPSYDSDIAPYAPFNSKSKVLDDVETNLILGEGAGYTSTGLRPGDKIYLRGSRSLAAGYYTLLPARYALLPGAALITPSTSGQLGVLETASGTSLAAGYRYSGLAAPRSIPGKVAMFEVLSSAAVRDRAEYRDYYANDFIAERAAALNIEIPQLPKDSGSAVIQATQAMNLRGAFRSRSISGGRGAKLDISSPRDFVINADGAPSAGAIALDASVLNSFEVESLLIGGTRSSGTAGTSLSVKTGNIRVDNPGIALSAPEIILAANSSITLAAGSSVVSSGGMTRPGETLLLNGNGVLVRASGDRTAKMLRTGVTNASGPMLTIGPAARVSGPGVTLDSSSGTSLDPTAIIRADSYYLHSGRISIQLDNPGALLPTNGLVLGRAAIQNFVSATSLSLLSYSSLDIYGVGTLGSPALSQLTLSAGQIRGFNQAGGTAAFEAADLLVDNRAGVTGPGIAAAGGGTLALRGNTVRLGTNQVQVDQFANLIIRAQDSFVGEGTGGLSLSGALSVDAPLLAATAGARRTLSATGAITLASSGPSTSYGGRSGLGATLAIDGLSISSGTSIYLPSGSLTLRATGGNLNVSGIIDVSGLAKTFYDVTRYTDAGEIRLFAPAGNIRLAASSVLNLSAPAGGGDAGSLQVSAPAGVFDAAGSISARAGAGGALGSFNLDVLSLASLSSLSGRLTSAGLTGTQSIRVRTGDVTVDGNGASAVLARSFSLSADQGKITVTGTIDASGRTGGAVSLAANGAVILQSGSRISVAASDFDNAGKGGSVRLEAGTQRNGVAGTGQVDIRTGSSIDLSVASLMPGSADVQGTSAYEGKFSGILHIRAPQNATFNDLLVNPINGVVKGASSILVEGYRLYDLTASGGTITSAVQTTIFNNAQTFLGASGTTTAGYTAMMNRLLANNAALGAVTVLAPGVEIVNRTGSLTLGTTSSTSTSDWNLSTFRFGAKRAPGVLTLRAAGDLVFLNTLSDGFAPTLASTNAGWLWSAQPTLLTASLLPVNAQSWSYRLVAGSDFGAADFRGTASAGPSTGSLLVGKNAGANSLSGGSNALTSTAVAQWYQVIRTGSGNIDISTRGDVRLLNQLATIYTAGSRVTNPTLDGGFVTPSLSYPPGTTTVGNLGRVETAYANYPARYTTAGGNVNILAGGNIERMTRNASGQMVADSSRQLPNNWLLRRGYIDPDTGAFGLSIRGDTASTSWWVNFSNFFEGIGALGGGNINLVAGGNISNVDAAIPTNARMTSDGTRFLELGGGDLSVRAGGNINAGVYYVERGRGSLTAGGSIVTNSTRSPSTTNLTSQNAIEDSTSWLPTTLFAGKSGFDVKARGDVLLGPVANAFLLPPGFTNTYWYKTYFSTYSPSSYVNATSLGGSLSLRTMAVVGSTSARPLLQIWAERQQVLSNTSSAFYQPWLRLSEDSAIPFGTITSVMPATLKATAVSGSISLTGDITLSPSPTGTLELVAAGGISGIGQAGRQPGSQPDALWIASTINVSDANPASVPGPSSPFAFQSLVKSQGLSAIQTGPADFLDFFSNLLVESGDTAGTEVTAQKIQARHTPGNLHKGDPQPVRLYASGGDISGLTLFSPKWSQIFSSRDISDIAFYIQNIADGDASVVASGRDILPYLRNSQLRKAATASGNRAVSEPRAGDIQISGPGSLQVLAGRHLDLGTGSESSGGTGTGIVSIGNIRNTYLPSEGADIFAGAGIGFSRGLAAGVLNLASFYREFGTEEYLGELDDVLSGRAFDALTPAEQSEIALRIFYLVLRDTGRDYTTTGSYGRGFDAISSVFGSVPGNGNIRTRERDIRTKKGGDISLFAPGGSLTLAKSSSGARLAPPGIVTESGGNISIFTDGDVNIGDGRIFVLRGGNQIIWSSRGNIAAGSAAKTVQSARPTQVTLDPQSATVETDLAGLATGGGIGVLATVKGIEPGDVDLIAPTGTVDAGDAGIRATGNLSIAATQVLNADNISVGGTSAGVPTAPVVAAPNIGGLTSGSTSSAAASAAAASVANQARPTAEPTPEQPSTITVEVLGYGGEDE